MSTFQYTKERKTRQTEFLKQWPDASLDRYGVLTLCPKNLTTGSLALIRTILKIINALRTAILAAASSGCRRWSDGTTGESRQLFAVSKNEDFYSYGERKN